MLRCRAVSSKKKQTPPTLPGLVDTHCHLDYSPMVDDLPATLARAAAAGVTRVVHIGCSRTSMARAVAIAEAERPGLPPVYAVIGVHPHEATTVDDEAIAEITALAASPKVVGIGESGLDYHYNRSPPEVQKEAMDRHLELAERLGKPIILHIRDAHADAMAIIDRRPPSRPGIIHCFTGDPDEARGWLERGFFLSFSGISTFPSAKPLREAARTCPGDRLLLETDAPYLAPVPMRGRKNEPSYVAFTCANLAALRGEDPAALASQAAANAERALGLPAIADIGGREQRPEADSTGG